MLMTSIFYFSYFAFYQYEENCFVWASFKLVHADAFKSDEAKILSSGKGLN